MLNPLCPSANMIAMTKPMKKSLTLALLYLIATMADAGEIIAIPVVGANEISATPLPPLPPLPPLRVHGAGDIIKDCDDCPEMVVIPAGSFLMGSPADPPEDPFSNAPVKKNGEPSERPQHRVQIQSFAIGKYEVTQEQWYAVMGSNPSKNKGRTLPVEQVSWDDVQEFIAKLIRKTGQLYRLPSEAEWEYAARAGSTTKWSVGDDASKLRNHAWGNSSVLKTQVVGQKLRNGFGLFDMLGNVSEWTQDCWHDNYNGAPMDGSAWTKNCSEDGRVLRGGFFGSNSWDLRLASRAWDSPLSPSHLSGLRVVRILSP